MIQFDKNRKRVKQCPCGKSNKDGKFIPYIGHDNKGYCHACGKTFLPEVSTNDNTAYRQTGSAASSNYNTVRRPEIQPSFINFNTFTASLRAYKHNHLITYLTGLFGSAVTHNLIKNYFIGTSRYWNGATVFWQCDIAGRIRAGKVMLYDPATGKRVKQPFTHINWVHKLINQPDYYLKQCFFGEHLLINNTKPVALVESEKTAIIASEYLPMYLWLATGGSNGIRWNNPEVFKVLKGHQVVLWPDIQSYDDWLTKGDVLIENGIQVSTSHLLEQNCTEAERSSKLDIADFLVRFPLAKFKNGYTTLPP